MTPSTFRVNGYELALGLQWSFYSSRREHRNVCKSQRPTAFIEWFNDDGLMAGWMRTPFSGRRTVAGALLVGLSVRDALIYQPLDSQHVWVCALRDGLPLPETDQVLPSAEADFALRDLASYQPHLPILGASPQATTSLKDALATLPRKAYSQTALLPYSENGRVREIALGSAVVLTAGYVWWPAPVVEVPPPPAPRVEVVLPSPPPPVVRREIDPDAVRRAREDAIERRLTRPNVGRIGQQWLQTLRSLPISHRGYRPSRLECTAHQCQVDWLWRGGRFIAQAHEDLPGQLIATRNLDDYVNRLRTTWEFDLPRERLGLPSDAPQQTLLLLRETLDRLGIRPLISESPLIIRYESQGQSFSDTIGTEGAIRLVASNLLTIEQLFQRLSALPLAAERAEFTWLNGVVNVQLEVRYVVVTL